MHSSLVKLNFDFLPIILSHNIGDIPLPGLLQIKLSFLDSLQGN